MADDHKLLRRALLKRLASYKSDVWLFAAFGLIAVLGGAGLFVFLWIEFRTDDTELISQLVGGSTTLVTAGVGGAFLNKIISLRSELREGQEWLDLYDAAVGPPPAGIVGDIQDKILSWLEG